MEIQIRVYRNAECLSKNEPCVRETIDVDDLFNFHGLVVALKTIWPNSMITFNI